jgi:hypothetical protein
MATKTAGSKRSTKKASAKKASVSKTATKVKETRPCLCGCGTKVTRFFAPGHDARLRGMLLRGEVKSPSKEQKEFAKSHGVTIGANAS